MHDFKIYELTCDWYSCLRPLAIHCQLYQLPPRSNYGDSYEKVVVALRINIKNIKFRLFFFIWFFELMEFLVLDSLLLLIWNITSTVLWRSIHFFFFFKINILYIYIYIERERERRFIPLIPWQKISLIILTKTYILYTVLNP